MVVPVAEAMVAKDRASYGALVETGRSGNVRVSRDHHGEVRQRAITADQQMLDLPLGQPAALHPLYRLY